MLLLLWKTNKYFLETTQTNLNGSIFAREKEGSRGVSNEIKLEKKKQKKRNLPLDQNPHSGIHLNRSNF